VAPNTDRDRRRGLVDGDQAEHGNACRKGDGRSPRRTEAVADEAGRQQADQPGQPHQSEEIAGDQAVDATIEREGDDVGGDEEVVEAADGIDRKQQPEPRRARRLPDAEAALRSARRAVPAASR
jgi:hypothetical protein